MKDSLIRCGTPKLRTQQQLIKNLKPSQPMDTSDTMSISTCSLSNCSMSSWTSTLSSQRTKISSNGSIATSLISLSELEAKKLAIEKEIQRVQQELDHRQAMNQKDINMKACRPFAIFKEPPLLNK